MSHWVKLENNIVTQVIVGDNSKADEGESLVKKLGGEWLKTSYNGNLRNKYAAIGDYYDSARDIFITPKPYPSWVEDTEHLGFWAPPVPYPGAVESPEQAAPTERYLWDENTTSWVKLELATESEPNE